MHDERAQPVGMASEKNDARGGVPPGPGGARVARA